MWQAGSPTPAIGLRINPYEYRCQEFRRRLSNRTFENVTVLQGALSQELEPYWEEPALLRRLTGYSWWVEAVEAL